MATLLYFATAILIPWAVDRCVLRISRGANVALLLLPLLFTSQFVAVRRTHLHAS